MHPRPCKPNPADGAAPVHAPGAFERHAGVAELVGSKDDDPGRVPIDQAEDGHLGRRGRQSAWKGARKGACMQVCGDIPAWRLAADVRTLLTSPLQLQIKVVTVCDACRAADSKAA
jgi:hypothetical protein